MYYFTFKDIMSTDMGVVVTTKPSIPLPEEFTTSHEIPGVGEIISTRGYYKNITIKFEMNFYTLETNWHAVIRKLRNWLKGSGDLRLSDDTEYYYKVVSVKIPDSITNVLNEGATFAIEFTCQPALYIWSGKSAIDISAGGNLKNWEAVGYPIVEITGEGLCTIKNNNSIFSINVGGTVTIFVEHRFAVKSDGLDVTSSITEGDFDILELSKGNNIFEVSEGFQVSIIPQWRIE